MEVGARGGWVRGRALAGPKARESCPVPTVTSDPELTALKEALGAVSINRALDVVVRGDLLWGLGYAAERVIETFETPDGAVHLALHDRSR